MIAAAQYFSSGSSAAVELTEEEKTFAEQMRVDHLLLLMQVEEFAREMCICPSKKKSLMLTLNNVSSQAVWQSILTNVSHIEDTTDFFKSGAASMDVVR